MVNEQGKILKALKTALSMENDGKECFRQAGQVSSNEVGRKLLRGLALEEDNHRQIIREIYGEIRKSKGWPNTPLQEGRAQEVRATFNRTCDLVGVNVKATLTEIDALDLAINKEKTSYDFYSHQQEKAVYDSKRDFYGVMAGEEREHQLILLDYYEYLTDPVDWFTKIEHHSLDGG